MPTNQKWYRDTRRYTFISAVHNTNTDDIQFFDTEDIPETHLEELNDLKFDLEGHQ